MTNVLPMPERPMFYRLDEHLIARPLSVISFLERSARLGEALGGRFRIRKLKHVKRSDTQQLRGFAQAANP